MTNPDIDAEIEQKVEWESLIQYPELRDADIDLAYRNFAMRKAFISGAQFALTLNQHTIRRQMLAEVLEKLRASDLDDVVVYVDWLETQFPNDIAKEGGG